MNNFLGHYFSYERTRSRGKTSKAIRRGSIGSTQQDRPAKPAISITLKTGKPSRINPHTTKMRTPIDRSRKPPIIVEMHNQETPDETEMRFKSVDPEAKKMGKT